MILLLMLITATAAIAQATTTVVRTGKSCQVCIKDSSGSVCRYHRICPVQKEKGE